MAHLSPRGIEIPLARPNLNKGHSLKDYYYYRAQYIGICQDDFPFIQNWLWSYVMLGGSPNTGYPKYRFLSLRNYILLYLYKRKISKLICS